MPKLPRRSVRGASLMEAVAGLVILVPLVLALIDISAIVIAQTSNDALAKHAARQAATQTTFALRQQAAQAVVTAYGASSLCASPQMLSYSEPNSSQAISKQTVKVTTQIVCNLPVPVPLGGPSTQTFQACDVEPLVGVRAAVSDPTQIGSGSIGSTGSDTSYLILSSPLPTGLGGTPIQTPGAQQLPGAASPAAPSVTTTSNTSASTTAAGGGSGVGGGGGDGGGDGGGGDGGGDGA
jgi:Flp pilus assembly protein TadG